MPVTSVPVSTVPMTVVPVTTVPAQYRKLSRLEEQVFLGEEILLVKETKVTCLLDMSRGIIQILHSSRLYK